jgi:hypothetical protein
MTLSSINSRISFLTNTTVTDYTYLQRTVNINKWYQYVQSWMLEAQDEWDVDDTNNTTTLATSTTNLVASQQDYALPSNCLKVKRVEVSYDGTNWYQASPFDINERSGATTTSEIADDFSTTQPYYDLQNNSILLYPIPSANSTAGLKLWYDRSFTDFTYTSEASNELLTGTKSPGFDANFHDILALGASHEFKYHKSGDNSLMNEILMMKDDLKRHYSNKQKDRNLIMKSQVLNYD